MDRNQLLVFVGIALGMYVGLRIIRYFKQLRGVSIKRQPVRNRHQWKPYFQRSKKIKGRVYVFDFKGDMHASEHSSLVECVNSILDVATPDDIAFLRLESEGGHTDAYEDCADELLRLREACVPLTVSVHRFALSGGYYMASSAQRIIAKRQAMIGSIGVIKRSIHIGLFLAKLGIQTETFTAGIRKAPEDTLLQLTNERRTDAQLLVNENFQRFKDHIRYCRPGVKIDEVATGESWRATDALARGLVDAIMNSSDELRRLESEGYEIYEVTSNSSSACKHVGNEDDSVTIITDELVDAVKRIVSRVS